MLVEFSEISGHVINIVTNIDRRTSNKWCRRGFQDKNSGNIPTDSSWTVDAREAKETETPNLVRTDLQEKMSTTDLCFGMKW